MKPTHGGARKGAGRPPGSGKGRVVKSSSITLHPALWGKLDALRGQMSRSAWIAERVQKARLKTILADYLSRPPMPSAVEQTEPNQDKP